MIQHRVYQCPKCFNTLLVSNKMLHDLRCTVENPATYENILFRQSQQTSYNNMNGTERFSSRMSVKNDDGTMTDIVKEKNMKGVEEFIEIKYDPQGNIIGRKRASTIGYIPPQTSFHELNELEGYDEDYDIHYDNNNNNTYYEMNNEIEIRNAPSVIYETAEAQEIVYEAPAKYDPHVTINSPIEETVINSHPGLDDGTLNNIIRNTMSAPNNYDNNYNNYNIQNDSNMNGYDYSQNYSQTNDISTSNYNQIYDMNNFNVGSNDIYNNSTNYNSGGNGTIDSSNYNSYSYDYQY